MQSLSHSNREYKHYHSYATNCSFFLPRHQQILILHKQFSSGTSLLHLSCLSSTTLEDFFKEKNLSS